MYSRTNPWRRTGRWLGGLAVLAATGLAYAGVPTTEPAGSGRPFVNVTEQSGIRFRHQKAALDRQLDRIMPWMSSVGAAAAAADYDNDGWIDLYVTNSAVGSLNKLFRNNRDGTFTDVAGKAGVARANDEVPICSLEGGLLAELENCSPGTSCTPSASLRQGFVDHGLTLTERSRIVTVETGRKWQVSGTGRGLAITREDGALVVRENRGVSMDAVWGDYDNDGLLDLYVVKWGWNILYHQNGDGTFTDVTEKAGVGDRGNGNAAIWFDYDDDGYLDLYIGNYFRTVNLFDLDDSRQMHEDFETARDGGANVLYRNNGNGTFTDVSRALGVDDTGWTLDVGAADYDNDGDMDLFCANDFGQDRVFRNNADGTFTNVTDTVTGWDTNKGMNVDLGDYNNDGWLDLYITNIYTKEYVKEGNQLYRNMGDGTLRDVSFETNTYDAGWAWAGRFWDYDNDGDLDLMVANGYISGNPTREYFRDLALSVTKPGFDPTDARNWPEMGDATFAGYEPKRVFRNEGQEDFKEAADELGLADKCDGRGLAIADFDNDGDLDVYLSCQGQDGALYRNDLGNRHHWLEVELKGAHCNRDAIGTRVTVVSEGLTQIRELDGGNGDHSQCPYRLHFGLGQRQTIDYVEIRWPTGHVERFDHVAADRRITYIENTPAAFLEERKRWKEAQIEGSRRETEREQQRAATTQAGEPTLSWDEQEQFKKQYVGLKEAVEKDPGSVQKHHAFAMLLDQGGRRGAALSELERAIQLAPGTLLYANTYRTLVRRYGHQYFDRAIRFFEDLVESHPDCIICRLNKALAYVDKMPYPKLGIVNQGKLSNQSIAELDHILRIDPTCWTARCIRAMNHLHWPRKLGRAPQAIQDFSEAIALAKSLPADKQRDYFALGYVGLGDAYVKNRDAGLEDNLARARQAWEQGLKAYPQSPELKARMELLVQSPDQLIAFVEQLRGLEDPVDTDLSRMWGD